MKYYDFFHHDTGSIMKGCIIMITCCWLHANDLCRNQFIFAYLSAGDDPSLKEKEIEEIEKANVVAKRRKKLEAGEARTSEYHSNVFIKFQSILSLALAIGRSQNFSQFLILLERTYFFQSGRAWPIARGRSASANAIGSWKAFRSPNGFEAKKRFRKARLEWTVTFLAHVVFWGIKARNIGQI